MVISIPPMDRLLIEWQYFTLNERHMMRVHARSVAGPPMATNDDLFYQTPNVGPAPEHSVLDTCAAFGALWSAYYGSVWTLRLMALWAVQGGGEVLVPVLPHAPDVAGSSTVVQAPGTPTLRSVFALMSGQARRRRLWLQQRIGAVLAPSTMVTPTNGGFSPRDQQLMAYLSGSVTALLAPDGLQFFPQASLTNQHDRVMGG